MYTYYFLAFEEHGVHYSQSKIFNGNHESSFSRTVLKGSATSLLELKNNFSLHSKVQNFPNHNTLDILLTEIHTKIGTASTRYRGSTSQLVCVFTAFFLGFAKLSYWSSQSIAGPLLLNALTWQQLGSVCDTLQIDHFRGVSIVRVLTGSQLKLARVLHLFNPNSTTIQPPTITSGLYRFAKFLFNISKYNHCAKFCILQTKRNFYSSTTNFKKQSLSGKFSLRKS